MILSFWNGWDGLFSGTMWVFRVYYLIIDRERVAVWYPKRYIVWYMSIWCATSKCIIIYIILLDMLTYDNTLYISFPTGCWGLLFHLTQEAKKEPLPSDWGLQEYRRLRAAQERQDGLVANHPYPTPRTPLRKKGLRRHYFFAGGSRLTSHYCWQILSRKHPHRPQVQNDSPENDGLQKKSPFPKGWF